MKKAFTLVEIVLTIGIVFILFGTALVVINPKDFFKKSRDNTRLKDIALIAEALEEYRLKNGIYPLTDDTLYISNTSAVGGQLLPASGGWLNADLSPYLQRQYIDPVNNSEYNYQLLKSGQDYEIDVKLEYYTQKHTNDGGNNDERFEVGTFLNLIN